MNTHALRALVLCVVCVAVPSLPCVADRGSPYEGGGATFIIGATWLDVSDLNDELTAGGFGAFDNTVLSYGGGAYGVIAGRIVIGGEGHGFGQETSATVGPTSYVQTLSGGYGMFDAGALVVRNPRFRVFPMIGIGGGGMQLRITERPVPSFDQIVADPARESVLDIGGFMLQAALGLDYLLRLGEGEEGGGGFLFGVRAGYTQSFFNSKWRMGDIDVIDGPKAGISGFFIRASVGFGGYSTFPQGEGEYM